MDIVYDFYFEIKKIYLENGWSFSDDINIFGLRNIENTDKDIWNDYICVTHNEEVYVFRGTTDPGKWYTKHHKTGASHLCYGLHKKVWMVGTHGRKHPQNPALICHWRCKKAKMWYDTNRDGKNNDKTYGYEWAIDCHTSLRNDPSYIGKSSAGCQVIRNHDEFFNKFMYMIMESASYKKKKSFKFDYALLDINQLDKKFSDIIKKI